MTRKPPRHSTPTVRLTAESVDAIVQRLEATQPIDHFRSTRREPEPGVVHPHLLARDRSTPHAPIAIAALLRAKIVRRTLPPPAGPGSMPLETIPLDEPPPSDDLAELFEAQAPSLDLTELFGSLDGPLATTGGLPLMLEPDEPDRPDAPDGASAARKVAVTARAVVKLKRPAHLAAPPDDARERTEDRRPPLIAAESIVIPTILAVDLPDAPIGASGPTTLRPTPARAITQLTRDRPRRSIARILLIPIVWFFDLLARPAAMMRGRRS